uniref:RRM domain-containing protein n=1 Tax=Arundo donax TaxID=35708 RepID=A0A0A9DFR5_ARUDO
MGRTYDYSPSPPRGYRRSPSPPRGYRRRACSPSPRGHYGGHARDLPTSLLVRNLRRDCRPDDLRRPFGKFGRLKDIYLPKGLLHWVRLLISTTLIGTFSLSGGCLCAIWRSQPGM